MNLNNGFVLKKKHVSQMKFRTRFFDLLALVASAIAAFQPDSGREVEDVLGPRATQTLEVSWSGASPSVRLLLLLVFRSLCYPLKVVPLHLSC